MYFADALPEKMANETIVDAGNRIFRWFDQRSLVLTPNLSKCY